MRDQKTTKKAGFYSFDLEYPLKELMLAWVRTGRGNYLDGEDHKFVFFNVVSKMGFTQQAFSKFMARAFLKITTKNINLQKIRRMVSEGLPAFTIFMCSPLHVEYLQDNDSMNDWHWLATAMLTGVDSLRKTYNLDGLQKQAFQKV